MKLNCKLMIRSKSEKFIIMECKELHSQVDAFSECFCPDRASSSQFPHWSVSQGMDPIVPHRMDCETDIPQWAMEIH